MNPTAYKMFKEKNDFFRNGPKSLRALGRQIWNAPELIRRKIRFSIAILKKYGSVFVVVEQWRHLSDCCLYIAFELLCEV